VEAQSLFGEWLRARRKAIDLTQFQIAELAGCAEDTWLGVPRYDNGQLDPQHPKETERYT